MSADECGKCGRILGAGDCYGCVVDHLLEALGFMTEWTASMESLRAYALAVYAAHTEAAA